MPCQRVIQMSDVAAINCLSGCACFANWDFSALSVASPELKHIAPTRILYGNTTIMSKMQGNRLCFYPSASDPYMNILV